VIGVEQPITGSFGAATYPDDGTDPGALGRSADRALYRAKTSGKNRVEVAVAAGDPRELQTGSIL
jgi:GGDEF domain-containing protein